MSHTDDAIVYPNLASALLGAKVVYATDEWFAVADNLLRDDDAVWKEDLFTDCGKWMDGWETRRKRTEGHDWCIIQLGVPGTIDSIEIDTAHFTGNFSPKGSVQVASLPDGNDAIRELLAQRRVVDASRPEGHMGLAATAEASALADSLASHNWTTLVPLTPLGAGYAETRHNMFSSLTATPQPVTHLRLNMGPDGGIARLRVYGVVCPATPLPASFDLAAVEYGGLAVAWSNRHYGHPRNLLAPGRGNCMGDGWETARQPNRPPVYVKGEDGLIVLPGFDWSIIKLGVVGTVSQLIVDTHFFKGNYPESCMIEYCNAPSATASELTSSEVTWTPLLPRTRLGPHAMHEFDIQNVGPISHVRLVVYPDGGVMRLRVIGTKA